MDRQVRRGLREPGDEPRGEDDPREYSRRTGLLLGGLAATAGLSAFVAWKTGLIGSLLNGGGTPSHLEVPNHSPTSGSSAERLHGMRESGDSQLPLLANYEQYGVDTDQMMIFRNMPTTPEEALLSGEQDAATLKTWEQFGVAPLFIMQPSPNMDLTLFEHGKYDHALRIYMDAMKRAGITNGTWVPFAEGNFLAQDTRQNHATGPQQFVSCVKRAANIIKEALPADQSKISVLLNNVTYRDHSYNSATTSPDAFLPYVRGLRGTVDSIGYQGFPWVPEDTGASVVDAGLVTHLAQAAGVEDVWLNFGTWNEMNNVNYPGQGPELYTVNDAHRHLLLIEFLSQVQQIRRRVPNVSVNLFAYNNFQAGNGGTATFQMHTPNQLRILDDFAHGAARIGVPVTIFDSK
ncbi:MAG TPA: hypothetical protein VGS28_04955 [Candidatus Saccharimonadales bacterium]|nr:hypothetical protein [Candidatus Saccharimonadales bacterium]